MTEYKRSLAVSHIQLENFTANQLVSLLECNLPGNSRNSKVLWKLLLTKLSSILDPALDLLVDMVGIFSFPRSQLPKIKPVDSTSREGMVTDEINGSSPPAAHDRGDSVGVRGFGRDRRAQGVVADRRAADGQRCRRAVVLRPPRRVPDGSIRGVPAVPERKEPQLSNIPADVRDSPTDRRAELKDPFHT